MKTLRPLPAAVRIGDAERQQAAALLGEHWGAGRLDVDEFDERMNVALTARTDYDLAQVFLDLPHPAQAPKTGLAGISASERGRLVLAAASSGLVAAFLGLVAGVAGDSYRAHTLVRGFLHLFGLY